MTFDLKTHNARMVSHFLWLETQDPAYATYALDQYRNHPDSPNPNILADVKAEKARRLTHPTPASENSSANTERSAQPSILDRK